MKGLRRKWQKELKKDDIREMTMDEIRLNKKEEKYEREIPRCVMATAYLLWALRGNCGRANRKLEVSG